MMPEDFTVFQNRTRMSRAILQRGGTRSTFKPIIRSVMESLESRQLLTGSVLLSTSPTPEQYPAQPVVIAQSVVATIVTDKPDYSPGQTAKITGKGFQAGEQVKLQVVHADGTFKSAVQHQPWIVRADASGGFKATYLVGSDDLNKTLRLMATGLTSHRAAQETFKDGSATTTRLTSSANPSVFGQSVTFTATVTSGATGVVTFTDGATTLGTGTLNGSWQVVLVTSSLSAAAHSITARYGGDGSHAASNSPALTQTVRKASTRVALSVPGAPPATSIVRPTHIVVVIEEDRFANAIGDTANLPYLNQIASSGLVFTNSHGLNSTNQEGQMSYLGLYSGSTQGVTDNSNHGVFTGSNLAQSLANNGLSFSGYAESLPYTGDTSDNYASDPNNSAYDDLYVRSYNPMAQFSHVGAGLTNANVNQTFSSFPTTASGYANLPTVSFVIPNTSHNTHGSNDTDPYATDPGNYNYFRQNADAWLQQKMDGYLQWAKQNNSLLIVTGDEGDRAHTFANGFATVINGAAGLFVPGTDATSVTSYTLLRTIEDMFILPQLGNTATASDLPTNSLGLLAPAQSGGLSTVGQPVTFAASVAPIAPGGGTPDGSVQFILDGSNVGSPVTLSSGSAASPAVTFLTQGAHTVSAIYSASANFNASTAPNLTQTVISAITTTTLGSTLTSAVWGQGVTFTATVSSPGTGLAAPTGVVTFMDGATTLGASTLNGAGQAAFATSSLSVGSHAITAVYASNTTYVGSTSALLNEGVARDSSTVSLTSSGSPVVAGQSVTLTSTVTAAAPGAGTPTGTVTFMDGGATLGTVALSALGQAIYTSSLLAPALHPITVVYNGDAGFMSSTSTTFAQLVNPAISLAPTTTTLTASSSLVQSGQPVTFTASVAPVPPAVGTATGTVQFVIDGINAGSPVTLINGEAVSNAISNLSVATHNVVALYGGDSIFAVSPSAGFSLIVGQAATTATVATSAGSAVFGQPITFTATLAVVAPGSGIPTGTVTFRDGAATLGTATLDIAGRAAFATSTLSVASHLITVFYPGDFNFVACTSAALTEPVAAGASSVTLVTSSNPSLSGQSINLTATVSALAPGAGIPAGTVTFMDGGITLGSVALSGGGQAVFTTSTLTIASHSITGVYSGSANFTGSISTPLTQTVNSGSTGPANNNFANASSIVGTSATLTGTNSGATKETGEPVHAGNVGGKSVWWSWTAPSTGALTLDTQSSTFDTLLAVYTGTSVSTLTAVPGGSNDDDPTGGGIITSKVTFVAQAGTTYQIAVDGYGGASGAITLHLSQASLTIPVPPTGVAATQGTYSNKVQVTWSLVSGATAYDVWRSTTNSSAMAVRINSSDVLTNVYDDTSALPGTLYYYWVDAKNSAGASALSASASGSVADTNDDFANATLITGNSASLTATNTAATKQTGEPNHGGNSGGKSLWWTWTAQSSGTVTIDTHGSTFDTLLGVYTGNSVSTLSSVPGGSNDDDPAGGTTTSKVSFAATAGTVYRIAVDGYGGVGGSIQLHLNLA